MCDCLPTDSDPGLAMHCVSVAEEERTHSSSGQFITSILVVLSRHIYVAMVIYRP